MTRDNAHTYAWDADGNPTTVDSTTLTHDALDRAVEYLAGGTYYQEIWGAGGKLAIVSGQSLGNATLPLAGGGTALYQPGPTLLYRHPDWLGSQRYVSTSGSPTSMQTDLAYAPYGEYYAVSGPSDVSFTGQPQDLANNATTGLYDFMAREYAQSQGRWIQPDPAGASAVNPNDPQSWNRYAYVRNNPLEMFDPLGLFCKIGAPGCAPEPYQQYYSTELAMLGNYSIFDFFPPTHFPFPFGSVVFGNPPNPAPGCPGQANAPSPSDYQAAAQTARFFSKGINGTGIFLNALNLLNFQRGGPMDAQAYGGSQAYANYAFGVYMSAYGYSLSFTLSAANEYGRFFSHYRAGTIMDNTYSSFPSTNVANITQGFNDQQNGNLCGPS